MTAPSPTGAAPARSGLSTAVLVSVLGLGVSGLSFVNQLAIAHAFGAGRALDAYLAAISAPATFGGIASGVFTYALVPRLAEERAESATADVFEARAASYAVVFVVAALLVGGGGALLAPWQTGLVLGRTVPEVVSVARWSWCGAALGLLTGFLGAVAALEGRYLATTALLGLTPVFAIAAVLVDGGEHGPQVLAWAGVAASSATVLAMAARSPALVCTFLAGRWPVARRAARRLVELLPVAAGASAVFSIFPVVDAFWGARLAPGTVSTLGFAQRLIVTIGTVVAAGPAGVLQARIADAAVAGRLDEVRRDLAAALRLVLVASLPVVALLSLLAYPVVRLLFERGAFDAAATERLAGVLPLMLCGMVLMVGVVVSFRVLFALKASGRALRVGAAGAAAYFVLAGALGHTLGIAGIAAAYVASWALALALAAAAIWGGVGAAARALAGPWVTSVAVALSLATCAAALVRAALPAAPTAGTADVLGSTLVVAVIFASTYLLFALRLRPVAEVVRLADAVLAAWRTALSPFRR